MSDGLSARQTQLLKAVIDEYIHTANPVGSGIIEKKYNLGVSSATIRSEMVNLTDMKYLRQPHTSAGRVPTPQGMKFYINQLMEEKQLSLTDEVKAKEEVWDSRKDMNTLIGEAVHALAKRTHSLAVAAIEDGDSWHAGYANVFENPGFADMHTCQNVFSLLEETKKLNELFFQRFSYQSPVEVIFGEDLGWQFFEPVGMVATSFTVNGKHGAIGAIGPFGFNYPYIIPTVRYFGGLIEELSK